MGGGKWQVFWLMDTCQGNYRCVKGKVLSASVTPAYLRGDNNPVGETTPDT